MKIFKLFILFLVINFSALAIGSWLMNNGPITEWYLNLNQAPWTPPGWAFGLAWTSIMLCFSVYMAYLFNSQPNKKVYILFILQFIFNVSWNYVFFNQHLILFGLLIILALTVIVGLFLFSYRKLMLIQTLLILPYFLWLLVATSLNAYILFNN